MQFEMLYSARLAHGKETQERNGVLNKHKVAVWLSTPLATRQPIMQQSGRRNLHNSTAFFFYGPIVAFHHSLAAEC